MGTIMVSTYMVGYRRERQNYSCPMERVGSEEVKAVRNRLMWVA